MRLSALRPRAKLAALLLLSALSPVALAGPGDVSDEPDAAAVDETPSLWLVELNSAPAADGTSAARLADEKKAFRRSAENAGVRYNERYSFGTLWNGVSVSVNKRDITKLARLAGVKAIYPVVTFSPPERSTNPGVELITALQQTGADIAQNSLGLTGAGVKVAVMDTGIDYDHPDLGGCFGAGCRVFTGWDFVGDDFNADDTSPTYNPIAVPDPIPDDCNGHGTHVAGIVGANGAIRGVAPGVTFGAYRVFGCDGSTTSEIMIAAMERALQRRHGHAQHEHRRCVPVAAVSDGGGRDRGSSTRAWSSLPRSATAAPAACTRRARLAWARTSSASRRSTTRMCCCRRSPSRLTARRSATRTRRVLPRRRPAARSRWRGPERSRRRPMAARRPAHRRRESDGQGGPDPSRHVRLC